MTGSVERSAETEVSEAQPSTPLLASFGDWRPAVYQLVRHRVAAYPVFAVEGYAVARTVCDRTAYDDPDARGGPDAWMQWPPCPECAR